MQHQLVVEPTISNARGYRDDTFDPNNSDDLDNLKDVNIFSAVEMLTPGTARRDDAIRTAINICCRSKTTQIVGNTLRA